MLRAGKALLKVNEYGVGSWDFILRRSMKFPLRFHLQTGSGGIFARWMKHKQN
jgi:hypothetical protein